MIKITFKVGSSEKEHMILISDLNSLLAEIAILMDKRKKVTFTSIEGVQNESNF